MDHSPLISTGWKRLPKTRLGHCMIKKTNETTISHKTIIQIRALHESKQKHSFIILTVQRPYLFLTILVKNTVNNDKNDQYGQEQIWSLNG